MVDGECDRTMMDAHHDAGPCLPFITGQPDQARHSIDAGLALQVQRSAATGSYAIERSSDTLAWTRAIIDA
jgi:hypothetical protein